MIQKHILNLYFARTAGMLSGARRVAMLLAVMLLTMTAQTAWAQGVDSPEGEEGASPRGGLVGVWYTLDGRRLQGKPTQKGLYIHGGPKVVIK